jgi:hypothetical protein
LILKFPRYGTYLVLNTGFSVMDSEGGRREEDDRKEQEEGFHDYTVASTLEK